VAPPPPPPAPVLPPGQRNALRSAQDYLAYTSFSRTGLIEQLEYENYSTEDATWAVDNLSVDWNQQAALKAEEYLGYTSFSRQGLVEQLMYEGFTPQQAEYGASQAYDG
jgi:SOS response regulatory protein OraA/RecX